MLAGLRSRSWLIVYLMSPVFLCLRGMSVQLMLHRSNSVPSSSGRFRDLQLRGSCAGMTAPVATARALAASMSRLSCRQAITRLWVSRLGVVHHVAAQGGTGHSSSGNNRVKWCGCPCQDLCELQVTWCVHCQLTAHLAQSKVGRPEVTGPVCCSALWLSSVPVVLL